MNYSKEQREFLSECDRNRFLLEMKQFPGWEILCQVANQRINVMQADYLRDDASRDEVWERHNRLKAVVEFWAMMKDVVNHAESFYDQEEMRIRLYSLSQEPDLG